MEPSQSVHLLNNLIGDKMNLLAMRTKFRELSGRFDLVNADFSDNGADFFINEGRKFLDRLDETQKSFASCFRFIEIGYYSASFPYCRSIKEVWAATISAKWRLEKLDLRELIEEYLTGDPSARNTGSPLYYSPTVTRNIPKDTPAGSFESFLGWVDVPAGNANEYNTILINVPTEAKIVVEIKGLFYSPELVEDTDTNYWSEVHPMLLYMASMRQAEIINRNTQGVNDWTSSILVDMKQIGMDLVEEVISDVTQIED